MTVAATKTKAEQALTRNFEAVAPGLPGSAAVTEARKAAIGTFAALGLPHRRIEEWKFTDLRVALKDALPPAVGGPASIAPEEIDAALGPLASLDAYRVVFVDGAHAPELCVTTGAEGFEIAPLAAGLAHSAGRIGEMARGDMPGHDAIVSLNTAFVTDGAVLSVAEGAAVAKPLLLVFAHASGQGRLVTTRNALSIGTGAGITVIEVHVAIRGAAPGQANALSGISLGAGARLHHLKVTLAGRESSHLSAWLAALGQGAIYRAFQFTAATGLARSNLFITFEGEGAKLDISGLFLGSGADHIDTTLVVDHAVPGCESRELIKGVLADRARGVFQGKVIVRPDAQKSDGKQMAQALMLSPDAEFDSKPELEIFADDVTCGHGSTAAELDQDMLFYLRSRGLPLDEARALLIESFIGEAIDKIEDEKIREVLSRLAKARLDEHSRSGLQAPQQGGGGRT